MAYKEIPPYLKGTFQDDQLGYHYSSPLPANLRTVESLRSDDEWLLLLAILEHAKRGDFSHLSRLPELLKKTRDPMVVRGIVDLVGDAGKIKNFEILIQLMIETDDDEFRVDGSRGAQWAGNLLLVPYMLEALKNARSERTRESIGSHISHLLEPEPGELAYQAESDSVSDYSERVACQVNRLVREFGSEEAPVWRGELFSVLGLARKMYELLTREDDEEDYLMGAQFLLLRHRFAANTGIDCRNFYKERRFQPLNATVIVRDFLDSRASTQYRDGVRYFFGYPISES